MSPISSKVKTNRFNNFSVDGTGPYPITPGSTPAIADPTQRAKGFNPSSSAFSRLMSKTAAAPSFIPLEFPAVTVPFFLKMGFRDDNFSKVRSIEYSLFSFLYLGCSSISTIKGSPFLWGTDIGQISFLNFPWLIASMAFC